MKFNVIRRHLGDKLYEPGDEREASESDVSHLIRSGVLQKKREEKAEPEPKNKAEKAAPKNKSA